MFFRSILSIYAICLLLSGCAGRQGGAGALPSMAQDSAGVRLSQRIDEFMNSLAPQSFNGAIVVEKGRELIIGSGYGYAQYDKKLPFTTATLTNTSYFAQQLTAAAILALEAKGALKLQDPLAIFFPAFPKEKGDIMVEQLLQHTSGLPGADTFIQTGRSKKEFLASIEKAELLFAPGTSYQFSEAAYRLLAAVVEAASGQPYEVYVREQLLEPNNMGHTAYVHPALAQLVPASEIGGEGSVSEMLQKYREADGGLWHLMGSSGMLSSMDDVYRWERMLQKNKRSLFKYRHSMEEAKPEAFAFPVGADLVGWNLDAHSLDSPLLRHSSRDGKFMTEMLYFPQEELSVIILSNQFNGQVEQLAMQVARMALWPNYIPVPLPYSENKFVRIPQVQEARYARSLLNFIQGDHNVNSRAIVDSVYNPAFKAHETEETHFKALDKLKEHLGNARLEKAQQAWPQYMFTFFEPQTNAWYVLRLSVEQQAPYKITGMGLETVDALKARW